MKDESGKMSKAMAVVKKEMSLMEVEKLAGFVTKSGDFTGSIGNTAQAIVKIISGREIGLSPMMSVSKLFIVHGKMGIPGEIIGGMIKRSGKYNYKVVQEEWTDKGCAIDFLEKIDGKWEVQGRFSFTEEQAKKILVKEGQKTIKLCEKRNWIDYPKNHYFYITLSQGGRMFCPEATQGVYAREELGDIIETTAEPGIADKIDAAKASAESGAEKPLNGEIVEEPEKPTGQPEKPTEQQAAASGDIPTGKEEPKPASLEKLKELVALRDKLPGGKEEKEQIYQIFKRQLKIETPDEELTTAQVNILIGIVKNNIPKGEAAAPEVSGEPVDAEFPEGQKPPESECPAGCCEKCFEKGKKKKMTAGAVKLSKKMGKGNLCFKCLQAANK